MTDAAGRLRKIPSVSDVLELIFRQSWAAGYSRAEVGRVVKQHISELRTRLKNEAGSVPAEDQLSGEIRSKLEESSRFSLQRVINATGIIIHTNLGRAPLAAEALEHLREIASGYSNLELDLDEGTRGTREIHVEKFLKALLPVEATVVVNNNAAALLLILNTLAEGKDVIVSRGELIEIGGSFRLPEIMKKSGALLREVGTTNKTKVDDYRAAINENTGMILVVHPSNFQIVGFTQKPDLHALVDLGRQHEIPVVEDHGSGILIDLEQVGIPEEPGVQARLAEGVDLICFSGDKILGGPQAGIVAGRRALIQRLRKNPLFRALRVDKMVYSILEATLRLYVRELRDEIPVLAMLSRTEQDLDASGSAWIRKLQEQFPKEEWTLQATVNYVGGGVAPMKGLPSRAISLRVHSGSPDVVARALRNSNPAILSRIEEDRILFELRTLSAADLQEIFSALERIL